MAIWSLFTKQSKKAVLTNFFHQYGKSSKNIKSLFFVSNKGSLYIVPGCCVAATCLRLCEHLVSKQENFITSNVDF